MKKLIVIALVMLASNLFAQTNLTFYNFRTVGQSYFLNPALPSRQSFTLGLFDSYNQFYIPGITGYDLFRSDQTGKQSLENFLDNDQLHLKDIQVYNELNPLFFGFRIKKNYFSLGIQTTADHRIGLPKDLLAMAYYGNASVGKYFGKDISVSDVQLDLTSYASVYFGYTRDINEKLSLGFRAKYNIGFYNAKLERNLTTLTTDSGSNNAYAITLATDYELKGAGVGRISQLINDSTLQMLDFGMNYLNKPVGSGISFDFGMNYKMNNKLSFSASVLGVGTMKWKEAVSYSKKATLRFEGFNVEDPSEIDSTMLANFTDSLSTLFSPVETKIGGYSTRLNTQIYLGMQYNLYKSGSLGLVAFGQMANGTFYPGFSASFTQRVWRVLDLRANYNMYRDQKQNVGLGMALGLGPFMIYAVSDNLLGIATVDGTLKADAHYTNMRVGMNINIGGRFDRDNDGVPDRKDECKKVPGLIKFNGCPDSDNDSVPDSKDECLGAKGSILANGCPDADGDGVKDIADSCIDVKGSAKLSGCPDSDNDGMADKFDRCPNDSGAIGRFGCPDRDGDGVLDNSDACPDDYGFAFTNGCPDNDRDSVPDAQDECPGVPGSILLKGCPDLDGDGIINKLDECPAEAGPAATKGCPDADADGIPDKLDACPNEPGVPGMAGCPQPTNPQLETPASSPVNPTPNNPKKK